MTDKRVAIVDRNGVVIEVLMVDENWVAPRGATVVEGGRLNKGDVVQGDEEEHQDPRPPPLLPVRAQKFNQLLRVTGLSNEDFIAELRERLAGG
jgi:hypothetical protein